MAQRPAVRRRGTKGGLTPLSPPPPPPSPPRTPPALTCVVVVHPHSMHLRPSVLLPVPPALRRRGVAPPLPLPPAVPDRGERGDAAPALACNGSSKHCRLGTGPSKGEGSTSLPVVVDICKWGGGRAMSHRSAPPNLRVLARHLPAIDCNIPSRTAGQALVHPRRQCDRPRTVHLAKSGRETAPRGARLCPPCFPTNPTHLC